VDNDATAAVRDQILGAISAAAPLAIAGGGTKAFYGRDIVGQPLQMAAHSGIISYDPAELVLTARAGTRLAEIDSALAASGQCMPFEPPRFGDAATLGGMVACGIAGPARAYVGAVKDFVLGVTLMNGEAKTLRFGGQVMKNVAGYDIARTIVGSLGTLGILMDVSMKVLPRPPCEKTLAFELDAAAALQRLSRWAQLPSCLSASCWIDGRLYIRLSGSDAAIGAASARFGGAEQAGSMLFWRSIREQTHVFFSGSLVRVVVPALSPPLALPGRCLLEWGGAQRWFNGDVDFDSLQRSAQALGGFAVRFRTQHRTGEVFAPLSDVQMKLQRSLKGIFDPHGIFNRGRMYAGV
jgi:glycolate oxidase FAD binding subunit